MTTTSHILRFKVLKHVANRPHVAIIMPMTNTARHIRMRWQLVTHKERELATTEVMASPFQI